MLNFLPLPFEVLVICQLLYRDEVALIKLTFFMSFLIFLRYDNIFPQYFPHDPSGQQLLKHPFPNQLFPVPADLLFPHVYL